MGPLGVDLGPSFGNHEGYLRERQAAELDLTFVARGSSTVLGREFVETLLTPGQTSGR
jgi:hypothetical protein